ncbi:MAG: hypothetical protein M1818_000415 [Claussenomyces sp. TS43310]|nr:MAG: hypothetical protein M1818_000415 [Claussenomyces sp. TS43310]
MAFGTTIRKLFPHHRSTSSNLTSQISASSTSDQTLSISSSSGSSPSPPQASSSRRQKRLTLTRPKPARQSPSQRAAKEPEPPLKYGGRPDPQHLAVLASWDFHNGAGRTEHCRGRRDLASICSGISPGATRASSAERAVAGAPADADASDEPCSA